MLVVDEFGVQHNTRVTALLCALRTGIYLHSCSATAVATTVLQLLLLGSWLRARLRPFRALIADIASALWPGPRRWLGWLVRVGLST